jgi:hypothetical protein
MPEPPIHRWLMNNLTVEDVQLIEDGYAYTALELDPDNNWWLTAWDEA